LGSIQPSPTPIPVNIGYIIYLILKKKEREKFLIALKPSNYIENLGAT
jgi:hypothetical protein